MTCGSSECSAVGAQQSSLDAGIQTLTAWGGGRGSTKKRSRKKSPNEIHGAFTRAQQDSRLYNLKLDVNNLKQELHDLAIRRELLQARAFVPRANSNASVLRTVGRYFHGFEPGYRGDTENRDQSAFVRSIVDEDFSLGVTGLGVEMLLEQWLRYTQLFHVRETFLHSAEIITSADDDTSFVVAKCVMDFRGVLTRSAVDMIFPTARRDPELLLMALGREIAIPMVFHLFFNEDGRLVRHDAVADFFGAVREALGGDISTAVRFIADAHVGQESMLGPLPSPARSEQSLMEAMRQKKLRTTDAYDTFKAASPVDGSFGDDGLEEGEPFGDWVAPAPSIVSPSSDGSLSDDEKDLVDSYIGSSEPDPEEQQHRANVAWSNGSNSQSFESENAARGGRHSLGYLLSPP